MSYRNFFSQYSSYREFIETCDKLTLDYKTEFLINSCMFRYLLDNCDDCYINLYNELLNKVGFRNERDRIFLLNFIKGINILDILYLYQDKSKNILLTYIYEMINEKIWSKKLNVFNFTAICSDEEDQSYETLNDYFIKNDTVFNHEDYYSFCKSFDYFSNNNILKCDNYNLLKRNNEFNDRDIYDYLDYVESFIQYISSKVSILRTGSLQKIKINEDKHRFRIYVNENIRFESLSYGNSMHMCFMIENGIYLSFLYTDVCTNIFSFFNTDSSGDLDVKYKHEDIKNSDDIINIAIESAKSLIINQKH